MGEGSLAISIESLKSKTTLKKFDYLLRVLLFKDLACIEINAG
jgi:hypothetical protein